MEAISSNQWQWNKFVKSCKQYDFYHTADYHQLSESEGEGEPRLLVYRKGEYSIGFPLLIRPIDESERITAKKKYDATSVYGYGGPIASHENLPGDFISSFHYALKQYCTENRIISVFSRLHTLWDQKQWLDELGNIEALSKTISIDLTLPLDKQRAKYRKSNKSEINQLRRKVKCRIAETRSDIDDYIDIYLQNMHRVNAAKHYFFSNEYFYRLLDAKDFECFVMLAENEKEIMAGAMFTVSNNIAQYHLAGTKEPYLKVTPMKLILDEMRINAASRGLKWFHLGGGVGSTEDSLFRFKSGFSDVFHTFSIWKWIVDQDEYDKLVVQRLGTKAVDSKYFPLYRSVGKNSL